MKGGVHVRCKDVNVELITDATFIKLDKFVLKIFPTKNEHIGLFSVTLKTKFTKSPQYMRFKVNVTCNPNKIETVNCFPMLSETKFRLTYGNQQEVKIYSKRKDDINQYAQIELMDNPSYVSLGSCNKRYCKLLIKAQD